MRRSLHPGSSHPRPRFLWAMAFCCALLSGAPQAQNPTPASTPAQQPLANAGAASPAPATEPATAAPASPVVGDRNATVSDRIPPEQILWLEAGTDRFLARYQPDLSGLPRGTAIVLHDSGQHPSWPATVAALIDELPLHGWTVLAIELPAPAPDRSAAFTVPKPEPQEPAASAPTPGPAPAGAPAAASTEPAAPPEPASATPELLERQAQARIQAALDHLIAQRQTRVAVIGFGSGALRAAEFVRARAAANGAGDTTPVAALGLVAPLDHLPGLSEALPMLLPATELPALDLALRNDTRARAEAEARRRAVLHQRERDYMQLDLPPANPALSASHSAVVKRVRGWLQQHVAAGVDDSGKNREKARPQGAAAMPPPGSKPAGATR